MKISGHTAYTGTGKILLGDLPPDWKGPKWKLNEVLFENERLHATIVTDARCGRKFDDAPLSRLAGDLFYRLENQKLGKGQPLTLQGRNALRLDGQGNFEGVPLKMAVVVLKKDFCLYDFVYFASPDTFAEGEKDFESYLYGFKIE